MAARPGMTTLIQRLRSLTDAAEGQTEVNGVSYWTDDQLQDILDLYRRDVLDVALEPVSLYEAGTLVTKRFYLPNMVGRFIEDDPTVLQVVDTLGNEVSGYTADFAGRLFLFESDQRANPNLFVRCRTFDIEAAAAHVWLEKAGHRASLIDWRAGGQTLSEDQEYQHCMDQYKHYSGNRIQATRLTHTGYRGQ